MKNLTLEPARPTDKIDMFAFFDLMVNHAFKKEGLDHLNQAIDEEIKCKKSLFELAVSPDTRHTRLLVMRDGIHIIGCISTSLANDMILEGSHQVLAKVPEIGSVFVHPNHQGQGLGQRLMQAMISHLKNQGHQRFCMDSGYTQAQAIWTHLYGEPTYRLTDYWGPNSHHMIWDIPIRPTCQAITYRLANLSDAQAFIEIYNPYIEHTCVSFEYNSLSLEDMHARISTISESHLWLVCQVGDHVAGYAYASSWRSRPAYQATVETAIYFDANYQGLGLGYGLYTDLLTRLKAMRFKQAIGAIAGHNPASFSLHEKLGFHFVGKFEDVGYKFDHYIPITFYQKALT